EVAVEFAAVAAALGALFTFAADLGRRRRQLNVAGRLQHFSRRFAGAARIDFLLGWRFLRFLAAARFRCAFARFFLAAGVFRRGFGFAAAVAAAADLDHGWLRAG